MVAWVGSSSSLNDRSSNLSVKDRTFPKKETVLWGSNPKGKLDLSHLTTFPFHRSGWGYALGSLRPLHNVEGVLCLGVIEETFGWDLEQNVETGVVPIKRPWVGFMHNPPAMPSFAGTRFSPETILDNYYFKESLEYCQGLFVLSEHHKEWLSPKVDVPVVALKHPTEDTSIKFDIEQFQSGLTKKVVQVGAWLRNYISLKHLPNVDYKKICLNSGVSAKGYQHANEYNADIYNQSGEKIVGDYEEVDWLENDEYDEMLASSIIFLDLYNASANNAVIECIRREAPVLVNPLPAVKEYLGSDYPFYFETLDQAAEMLNDMELIERTYQYLRNLNKDFLDGHEFCKSIESSNIYRNLPGPPSLIHVVSEQPGVDQLNSLNITGGQTLDDKFVFIVCVRNQSAKIERCIRSILAQPKVHDYGIVLIDDASDDDSFAKASQLISNADKPGIIVRNKNRKGYCWNLYNSVRLLVTNPESICIEVNGDDFLPNRDVLSTLQEPYSKGVLKTFGDFECVVDDEYSKNYYKQKPKLEIDSIDYRDPWDIDAYPSWMHLRTYTKGLFDLVPLHYFWERDRSKWLQTHEDMSLHPKMAELAGLRVMYIDEVMYMYDITGLDHDHRNNAFKTYIPENFYRIPQGLFIGNSFEILRRRMNQSKRESFDKLAPGNVENIVNLEK